MAAKGKKPYQVSEKRLREMCDAIAKGSTYQFAAKLGGMAESTFYKLMNNNAEFEKAIKGAKEQFEEWSRKDILEDAKRSLKTLICGQEYEETKTEYESGPDGKPRIKKQIVTTKRVLPNATAVIFALVNRDPENWKHRTSTEIDGRIETESKSDLSLKNVPDNLLAELVKSIKSK